jgi:hypothetical protein
MNPWLMSSPKTASSVGQWWVVQQSKRGTLGALRGGLSFRRTLQTAIWPGRSSRAHTRQIFNQFVHTEVLLRMNAYSEDRPPRSVLVIDNARIYCSEELQEMYNETGILLVYLPPYSPDYNLVE